jgi:hypothetical protein
MVDLQYLANLSEVIGSVVVVLSLIYVAVQVRQNTQAQRMENYSRGLDRLAAMQSMLSQGTEISLLLSRGAADSSKLTPQERVRFTWALYEAFGAFEFMFQASKGNAIPEEVWTRWSAGVAYWLSFPGVQNWWHARPLPFTASFTVFVDSLLKDNPTDAEQMRRFREFLVPEKPQL